MSNCKCDTARTSQSGGSPLEMWDYTDNYTTHFNYANWDCYFVFTCNVCGTIWYLSSDFVDRPPYICRATRITEKEVTNLISWNEEELAKLIEEKGIRMVMDHVINGSARALFYGEDAPEDND